MKNNIITLCIVGLLLHSGCSKDPLDKKPISKLTAENFYKTEDDARSAVNAAYDPLQWGWVPKPDTFINEFIFGDIISDDAEKGGENLGDMAAIQALREFRGNAATPNLQGLWFTLYQGIYRANLVIEKVPGIAMNVELRDRIVGEAKFLRAYYYFYLARMFGGAPIITKPLIPSEYKQTKASKEAVFAQVESDLIDAAKVLKEKKQYAAADMGRATKGAANGMLVRVYVYQKKWAQAEPLALEVINSAQYALDPDYKNIFSVKGENGSESIFEIQHMVSLDGWGASEGNFDNILQGSRRNGYGWGFNCPTQNFVDEFEPGDPRLKATVIFNGDTLDAGQIADNSGSPTSYYSRKYLLAKSERPTIGEVNGNGQSNRRVLRYADLLLMYAEAAYHNGNETIALEYLNKVRARARGGNPAILLDRASTGNQLLLDIYHERRVELGMEAIRFFDIVRQGTAGNILRADGRNFVDGVNEVFPIPQTDIDYSGGTLTQNPGY